MQLSETILRVFEVRAKAGSREALKQKLAVTSVAVVDGEPGNQGYLFGEAVSSDGDDLVFISVWQNLEAVRSRFGEDWQQAYLPKGYASMILDCSVRHFKVNGQLVGTE